MHGQSLLGWIGFFFQTAYKCVGIQHPKMSLSLTVQDKTDRLGPLACEAEAGSVSSRSQFRTDLITVGVNF